MAVASLLMAEKDSEKPMGRPKRELPEGVANARLYATVVSKLNDIFSWRKLRLGQKHVNLADMFEEVFRPLVDRVWREELTLFEKGTDTATPTTPSTTPRPEQPGIGFTGLKLEVAGLVAAGKPMEPVEPLGEWFDFQKKFGRPGCYMLRVKGDSMIGKQIADGDMIVVREVPTAGHGEIVVADVRDVGTTLKRLHIRKGGQWQLHAYNETVPPITFDPKRDRIIGVLVGVVRETK